MSQHTILVSTQTPLLRFEGEGTGGPAGADLPAHRLSPGGVCRMVLPTLQNLRESGWMKQAYWYSLQPGAPAEVNLDGGSIQLRHVDMPAEQTGALIGLSAPCVMRWHVPFDPARIPAYTRNWMLRVMEDFDAVMVSTRRDLQGLMDAGFNGKARQVYPHINVEDWPKPTDAQASELEEKWSLKPQTRVFLMVARMDPMKRHDLAIRAFAHVHKQYPETRLVLVGNGSFSGPMGGVTGKGKSEEWREKLKWIVAELGLTNAVTFAHWIPDGLLAAAYQRADAVLLPSDIEGFGLTPLEAWCYGRVPIISTGCGASEIIMDQINGLVFPSGSEQGLTQAMLKVVQDPSMCDRIGDAGRVSLPHFAAPAVNPKIRAILNDAVSGYSP